MLPTGSAVLNFSFLKEPRRQVCIRRDKPDFVVASRSDDEIIFRHHNAHPLRKLCGKLRWEIVSDVMPDSDPATW